MLPGIGAFVVAEVGPQTVLLTSGSGSWTVPPYNQIIFEIWGGGGRGGGFSTTTAATATTLTFPSVTMTANPGNAGSFGTEGFIGPATGGTASGGDVNTTGGSSSVSPLLGYGKGGDAPNGQTISGGVGAANTAGTAPGGGGSSAQSYNASKWQVGAGGGAGGYSRKTFGTGTLVVGSSIPYSVGLGAVASSATGNGGSGYILIRVS